MFQNAKTTLLDKLTILVQTVVPVSVIVDSSVNSLLFTASKISLVNIILCFISPPNAVQGLS